MDKENLKSLGQKVDYTSTYDPSQLEPIDRQVRRSGFKYPMFGVDVWTAFEVSFLLPNKLPVFLVLRITNPANSKNIFESKSLKLYLNSFNNTIFSTVLHAVQTIKTDLSNLAEGEVLVELVKKFPEQLKSLILEEVVSPEVETFDYSPQLLKTIETLTAETVSSNLLRSNCEITNQPDWANIEITYSGSKGVSHESLLKYIVSFRNHQEFHEPTCERIYQDLYRVLSPDFLEVKCQYTRRGGIDINPIRSSCSSRVSFSVPKLLQQ